MKPENEEKVTGLPENAYRELKEGESYKPLMSPNKHYPEVTPWSVLWGLVMAVIFSAAAAYLGLKVGQVFEAAIPIAIIAVGLSSGFKRKNALGENVIIQSIGASSGVIVAGAIFTLPALYILQDKYPEITVNFFEVFISSLLGGIIGILLLIPFRKYFVSDMHGKYSLPGSYGYHASTRLRRERRKPSETIDLRRINRWFVRLHHRYLRLAGETISTRIVRSRGRDAGREGQRSC